MFEQEGQVRIYTPYGHLSLTSLGAATEAAVAGAGIAQVSDALAFTAVADGKLQPILSRSLHRSCWYIRVTAT